MKKKLKNNTFLRGLYFFYNTYFSLDKKSFGHFGKNITINPPFFLSKKENIFLYDNIGIGPNCFISAHNEKLIIKSNCAIAEGLTIHTGNHANVVGKSVTDINEDNKPKGYDKQVIIEEDVWIGANVTILAGVIVGRGSIVAAGSVLIKDVPPYCIVGGVPAKVLKFRFESLEDIFEHESILYNKTQKLDNELLINNWNKYEK
ncbi:acyltransferase [Paenimyroides tangerinum]|nr:acyltransferase [Paenimyroides tangerinum]